MINVEDYEETKYVFYDKFRSGRARVRISNGKWGFIDKSGNETILCKYLNAQSFSEGKAAVQNQDFLWGFIDKDDNTVIDFKYSEVLPFNEGLAAVKVKNKWGFIDRYGEEVIPPMFDQVSSFSEGLAAVKAKGKWGYINYQGKNVIPHMYKKANDFHNGMAHVLGKNNKQYFINEGNEEVLLLDKYEEGDYEYSDGVAILQNKKNSYNGLTELVDIFGVLAYPNRYNEARKSTSGIIAVKSVNYWGFINLNTKTTSKYLYEDVKSFHCGLAPVKMNGKWGYINQNFDLVIPCMYHDADEFSEGLAHVTLNDNEYYINKNNNKKITFGISVFESLISNGRDYIHVIADSKEELLRLKIERLKELRECYIEEICDYSKDVEESSELIKKYKNRLYDSIK